MKSRLCFYLLVILATILSDVVSVESTEGPVVRLKDGAVRGLVVEADGGRKVNFFQGIRFGRAERFNKPTPVEPWTGVYNATERRFSCPQVDINDPFMDPAMKTSEDCLFLNVWQPAAAAGPKSNLSVMVWIYGGGFQGGSIFTDMYDAFQISGLGDVVVVAVNYRLGLFGFASFGTKEFSGNLGFHDQILGLKWVQNNIRQFGGNPADVTIFGESAGSMSAGVLILSPLTTGLFHRAILQSGAPIQKQLVEPRNVSLQRSLKFAQQTGCDVTNLHTTLECLKEKTTEELMKSFVTNIGSVGLFVPNYGDEVLPDAPFVALNKVDRKIDLMFGVCRNEGTYSISPLFPEILQKNLTLNWVKKGIEQLLVILNIPTNGSNLVLDNYTKHLTNKSSLQELRIAVSDVFGDYFLVCPTVLFGEQVARRSAPGNHFYSYRLMAPLKWSFLPWTEWMGVIHGEDIYYLFGIPITFNRQLSEITKENVQLSRDMITAWTQFAKTGQIQPVSGIQWNEAVAHQKPNQSYASYFSLDSTDYKMVNDYWKVTCEQVWKPLIEV